jgi:hypothetical protein
LKTSRKEVPINYDRAIAIAKLVSWWCYVFNSIVNLGRFMCLLFTNISTKAKKRCSFNKKITVLGTDHLTFWSTLYFLSDPILSYQTNIRFV